jgi:outer membrane receptor protein involved in Fe transport
VERQRGKPPSRIHCSVSSHVRRANHTVRTALRNANFATYVQDDWRATPNLTINMGLRWEYFGKPPIFDRIASQPYHRTTLWSADGTPRNLIDADKNNFGPRIGFACVRAATKLR